MSRKRKNVKDTIRQLFDDSPELANRDVVAVTGLTRQAVHYHLQAMVDDGELEIIGAGRATRYRRRGVLSETLPIAGLEEHLVWRQMKSSVSGLAELPGNVEGVLGYAFTEMLNNAIDHSDSRDAVVTARVRDDRVELVVRDHGVGAFEHVRGYLGLGSLEDAVVAISKGKTTTAAEQHTGQGIFFTSKAVDLFILESNGVAWIVDNQVGDRGIGESEIVTGTRVTLALSSHSETELRRIFDEYAPELDFDTTRVFVELVKAGGSLVSRSEAKRVAVDLDRFKEAIVDFTGVNVVGQGFADELFRVWTSSHPDTALKPVGMSEAVAAVVLRAMPDAEASSEERKRRQGRLPPGVAVTIDSVSTVQREVSGDIR